MVFLILSATLTLVIISDSILLYI